MARINFYDTPLSQTPDIVEIKAKKTTVENEINKYLESKEITVEKYEVYNIETGETTYEAVTPDGYKVITIVNGEEKPLDTKIHKNDIVNVVFIPRSSGDNGSLWTIIGSAFMIVAGAIIGIATSWTGVGLSVGTSLIIGGAMGLIAGIVTSLTTSDDTKSSRNTDDISKEQALVLKGAENQLITGSRFPFVFGKIASNPLIMGSPYHETYTKPGDVWRHDSQYMTALYCVGYGPLKLTDFKIGNNVLCYNRPRLDVPGEENNETIIHGNIDSHILADHFESDVANRGEYFTYNAERNAYIKCYPNLTSSTFIKGVHYKLNPYIPAKWKNNDIQLEILQRGLRKDAEEGVELIPEDKFGTLYNRTIIEDQVDANILYIHDEDIQAAAEKSYKGVAIPIGYRTNTVRLSQNCPSALEVEIDFSNGLFRSRSEKSGNTSSIKYYDIPVRLAVQWRAVKNNNPVSNAENGTEGGWQTFDYLCIGNRGNWRRPSGYTANNAILDMTLNAGASQGSTVSNAKTQLRRYAQDRLYQGWVNQFKSEIKADPALNKPYATAYGSYYTDAEREVIASNDAAVKAAKEVDNYVDTDKYGPLYKRIEEATLAGYPVASTYNQDWTGVPVFTIDSGGDFNTGHAPRSDGKEYNANERLYVFRKEFNAEEVKSILDADADYVEVRVIRLTPCYIDQSGTNSDDYGDFSYQDLCKWTYLRTFVFDKDRYKEAIKTNSSANPSEYPLRPIREEDLHKFTFIALRLKQDVAETGGQTLKKLRVLTESFSPVYDNENHKWLPEGLVKSWKYYQKVQVEVEGKLEWKFVELTEEEYRTKVLEREPNLIKQENGNNYVDLLADKIFNEKSYVGSPKIRNYKLLITDNEDDVSKYNNTNTASSTMLALVGPQTGNDAKTYDDINLDSAKNLFNFCEDVTDGREDPESPDGLKHIKFSCNGIITEAKKLEEIVKSFLLTGRSVLKRDDNNRYEFLIGKPVKYSMNVLNNKNVISKSNSRTFQEVPSGLQLNFPDEKDDYTVNPVYVMDRGESWEHPSKQMEQLSIPYVTNADQIWSLGCYNLAGRIYQREVYTRTVGKVGLTFTLGDVIDIQDDSLEVGTDNGGRIVELIGEKEEYTDKNGITRERITKLYGFTVDEPYMYTAEIEGGKSVQGVTIVQAHKYGSSRVVTLRLAPPTGNEFITSENMVKGLTNLVALDKPIIYSEDGTFSQEGVLEDGEFCTLDPKEGDLVAFGKIKMITEKAQIVAIKPSQGKYTLTLVPYNDLFYNYGKAIPTFNPVMSRPKREDEEIEFVEYATKTDIATSKADADENKVKKTEDVTAYATVSMCKAYREGIQLMCNIYDSASTTPLNGISFKWTIYKEDFNRDYNEADPQPQSQEDFGKGTDYYALEDEKFVYQTKYKEGVLYYTELFTVENKIVKQWETTEPVTSYLFDRSGQLEECDGYPEDYHLFSFKVSVVARLTVSSETQESLRVHVDTDGYGTWIPTKPTIDVAVQDRHAILTFSHAPMQRALYGTEAFRYHVKIRRLYEDHTDKFSKPNIETSSTAYPEYNNSGELVKKNETAYTVFDEVGKVTSKDFEEKDLYYFSTEEKDFVKAEEYEPETIYYEMNLGDVVSGNSFVQTLPLDGQGSSDIKATDYEYQVFIESINGQISDTETASVQALITNIRDIVKAKATEKEKYVESLSAISANLGEISGGRLGGKADNYWTLSTRENAAQDPGDNNSAYKGAFRIGDENEFFMCKPVPKDTNPNEIDHYEISFKVGNFEVTSQKATMNNEMILYEDGDYTTHDNPDVTEPYHTIRLRLSSSGMTLEKNNGTSDTTGPWVTVGTVTMDRYQNLFISNAEVDEDNSVPHLGVLVPPAHIYHFVDGVKDEHGGNAGNVNFDGITMTDTSVALKSDSGVFRGKLKRDDDGNNSYTLFIKDGYLKWGGDFASTTAGNCNSFQEFEALSRESWGGSAFFVVQGD